MSAGCVPFPGWLGRCLSMQAFCKPGFRMEISSPSSVSDWIPPASWADQPPFCQEIWRTSACPTVSSSTTSPSSVSRPPTVRRPRSETCLKSMTGRPALLLFAKATGPFLAIPTSSPPTIRPCNLPPANGKCSARSSSSPLRDSPPQRPPPGSTPASPASGRGPRTNSTGIPSSGISKTPASLSVSAPPFCWVSSWALPSVGRPSTALCWKTSKTSARSKPWGPVISNSPPC